MLTLRTAHPPKPHVVATSITKTAGDGAGSTTVYTGWKPHIVTGMATDDSNLWTQFICGENGSGTVIYTTAGVDAVNSLQYSSSAIQCKDSAGDGWSATITLHSRSYTITWSETGSAVTAKFEFLAIRAKNCWHQQISNPVATGSENYTGAGFDPNVVLCFAWQDSTIDPSIGWGYDISDSEMGLIALRSWNNDIYPESYRSFQCSGDGAFDGWLGKLEGIADGFTCDWQKINGGGNVDADCWALEYEEVDARYYAGVPVDDTDIVSGASFTPVVSITQGVVASESRSCGMKTSNRQICFYKWAAFDYNGIADVDVRRDGSSIANYYEVDHTFGSGVVTEDVTTHGAPPAGVAQSCLAFGENGGCVRRGA